MDLVSEIFPENSFYFKVKLAAGVSDEKVLTAVRTFNLAAGDGGLFHSIENGYTTTLFKPAPPPRAPRTWALPPPRSSPPRSGGFGHHRASLSFG